MFIKSIVVAIKLTMGKSGDFTEIIALGNIVEAKYSSL